MNTLDTLPINKTYVFHSPLEGNNCLVRTGTIKDTILSFFNSVLISSSRNFKKLDTVDRDKLIMKVKDVIFSKINKKMWKFNGLQTFKKILRHVLVDFYKYITTSETIDNKIVKKLSQKLITNKKEYDLYEIITEILPYNIIIDTEDPSDGLIETFINLIKRNVKIHLQTVDIFTTLNEDNIDYIIKNISNFLNTVLTEVEFVSFKNYKYEIDEINEILVNTVSNYFNCNIYFIDSKTRLPFVLNNINDFENINSIIILSLEHEHYEAVGILKHGNIINYEFLCDDALVMKMNKLISIKYNERKRREFEKQKEEIHKCDEDKIVDNDNHSEVDKTDDGDNHSEVDKTSEEDKINDVDNHDEIDNHDEVDVADNEDSLDKSDEIDVADNEDSLDKSDEVVDTDNEDKNYVIITHDEADL